MLRIGPEHFTPNEHPKNPEQARKERHIAEQQSSIVQQADKILPRPSRAEKPNRAFMRPVRIEESKVLRSAIATYQTDEQAETRHFERTRAWLEREEIHNLSLLSLHTDRVTLDPKAPGQFEVEAAGGESRQYYLGTRGVSGINHFSLDEQIVLLDAVSATLRSIEAAQFEQAIREA